MEGQHPIVDVDGSYLYKNDKSLVEAGKHVIPPLCPPSPPSGWRAVNKHSCQMVGPSIPTVTAGTDILHLKVMCASSS